MFRATRVGSLPRRICLPIGGTVGKLGLGAAGVLYQAIYQFGSLRPVSMLSPAREVTRKIRIIDGARGGTYRWVIPTNLVMGVHFPEVWLRRY